MIDMNKVLRTAKEKDASDIHLVLGLKPMLRIARALVPIEEIDESENLDIVPNIYKNEVISLLGGTLDGLMQFKSAYTIHYAGVKYAVENKYDRYNFYGITGIFNESNPLYGLYLFKKSFGGHVVELLGEYDLIISKFWYRTYKIAFGLYHAIKNIFVYTNNLLLFLHLYF